MTEHDDVKQSAVCSWFECYKLKENKILSVIQTAAYRLTKTQTNISSPNNTGFLVKGHSLKSQMSLPESTYRHSELKL